MNSKELLLELKRKVEIGGGDGINFHIGSMANGEITVKSISVNGEKIIDFTELLKPLMKKYLPGISF